MFDRTKKAGDENSTCEHQLDDAETAESIKISEIQEQNNDLSALLEALEVEEKSLLQEKTNLIIVEEQLTQKLKSEIAAKKQKIDELKGEIPGLKQRCEILATVLGIQIQK